MAYVKGVSRHTTGDEVLVFLDLDAFVPFLPFFRILEELVARHGAGKGALDVYEAFDLGWPGEDRVEAEAAAERVYWVVGVLRRLGLDGLLLTSDEGYYLDPSATVLRG